MTEPDWVSSTGRGTHDVILALIFCVNTCVLPYPLFTPEQFFVDLRHNGEYREAEKIWQDGFWNAGDKFNH